VNPHLPGWLERTGNLLRQTVDGPLVTLSYAQSLDGCITAKRGRPTPLSGPESSEATHLVRSHHEGVLIGVKTLISDDPRLNVRLVQGSHPRPVILDSNLNSPLDRRLWSENNHPLILCGKSAPDEKHKEFEGKGVEIRRLETDPHGRLLLSEVLHQVKDSGIDSLMVEGGGEVISSFIAEGLWDRAAITVAPCWINGYKPEPIIPELIRLCQVTWIPLGGDVMCVGVRMS
jgi:GTP cyclohydrolase II